MDSYFADVWGPSDDACGGVDGEMCVVARIDADVAFAAVAGVGVEIEGSVVVLCDVGEVLKPGDCVVTEPWIADAAVDETAVSAVCTILLQGIFVE